MQPAIPKRVLPLAWLALGAAMVAAVFALYGSLFSETHLPGSPLNIARKQPGVEGASRASIAFVAYFLPFGLGLGAAFAAGHAMRAIDLGGRVHAGNRHAVFAIMIGGLAAVVSGCMILALYGWEYVPALYLG